VLSVHAVRPSALMLLRSDAESSQTATVLAGNGWWTDTQTDTPAGRFRHLVKIVTLPRPCLAILAGSRNHTIPADRRPIWVLAVMTHDRSRANLEIVLDHLISRLCRDPVPP
jgi:hypothetical protein